ncbi:rhodanese-like domain-containing protein [Lacticaseibacillus hulanensis]|uniref:rhodanese-like domain-containing protein n=1 Tax=Lacticaseibacillus hulanensis TaxID=2493111 RepID=UPI000FDBCD1D|nr:rhodanese-like domain-containing protein [Lacticaseibacillus hulanensis]
MFFGAGSSFFTAIWVIIALMVLFWAGSWLYRYVMTRRYKKFGGELTGAEFEETMRKAQIIDLRESNQFDSNHILGARNIPLALLSQKMSGLRKDLPVYLYDATGSMSLRAVRMFSKDGFEKIYWLKDGFAEWSGKTKKN